MTNPFDTADRTLVLANSSGHRSRWPAHLAVPDGWRVEPSGEVPDVRPLPGRPGPTIPSLFEAQVRRTPRACAVVADGRQVSYSCLNASANRVAHHLLWRGAGPHAPIAFALPRSLDMIVAMLGAAKAGAAYLPIDPSHPAERVETVLREARVTVVLRELPNAGPVHNPSSGPLPSHPAYLIPTSGSTGTPKIVTGLHEGVVNRVTWFGRAFPEQAAATVCAKTSAGVIDGTTEVFGALLHGGRIVLADDEQATDPLRLAQLLAAHDVDRVTVVPSLLNVLLDEIDPSSHIARGMWICSGEPLSPKAVAKFRSTLPHARLFNFYGTTEVVGDSVFAECGATSAPMGKPIDRTDALVLDAGLKPATSGELYLAGAGLAQGYLHQPELTAQRFVANPFGDGERMYRTGDLVRLDEHGDLHYLGRADDQVKIRGFRVEIGEVVAAVERHPAVASAVVAGQPDELGGQRLVAHYVGDVNEAELRGHVRSLLPEHMVPSAMVQVPAFPLLPSGKIDRRALPEPVRPEVTARSSSAAEDIVAGLFAEVLGLPRVGADEDFYALGGHSLQAARLAGRLRAAFGGDVSVATVLGAPTVSRLTKAVSAAEKAPPLRPGAVTTALSAVQRRLWVANQIDPASYAIPVAVSLRGVVDRAALALAIGDVVRRHEPLRTVFPDTDGIARAEVVDRVPELGNSSPELEFDLATDIPLRTALVSESVEEHTLFLVLHHIAFDELSLAPLMADLGIAYTARVGGRAPSFTPLIVRYADYVRWQQDSGSEEQLTFWRTALDGMPHQIELPADRPRPAVSSGRGGVVGLTIPAALHRDLRELAKSCHATVFMVVQAALAALLTRLGAGHDLAIGTTTAGRADEALNDVVGVFMNTLALRTNTSGDPTLRELVGRVRETDLAALSHQDVPFDRVVEAMRPDRSSGAHPLFQVLLELHGRPEVTAAMPGLTARARQVHDLPYAKLDLEFVLFDQDGGLDGHLRYAADLFDRGSAELLARRLVGVLASMAADPSTRLGDVEVLTGEERERIASWNETASPFPETTVSALFEEQVTRAPDATAVIGPDGVTTYAELNARANRMAHHLRKLGVRHESFVGICLPPSVDVLAAILGVLKAGAAYVPFDPGHPRARAEFALEDTRAQVVIARSEDFPGTVVDVGDWPDEDDTDLAPVHTPLSAVYAMFTSGSTGRPKGVVISHHSLINYLWWAIDGYGVHSGRGAPMVGSIAFDLSIPNFLLPLVTGRSVTLVEEQPGLGPLAELLRAPSGLSLLKITPGHLDVLRATLPADAVIDSVDTFVVGADEVRPETVAAWRRIAPGARVINEYGPTETVVGCSVYEAGSGFDPSRPVPIGKPIANTRMYVLNDRLRPVPPGVAGELFIAGAGVARGYLGRPGLTASRFLPDPFGPPGTRMYRTGDGARFRANGDIDFLGRLDDQVKIRGYRIEPGEIEAALLTHPGVSEAVVVARTDSGRKHLVTYAVAPRCTSDELADHLAERLPPHMVPDTWQLLERLPLTSAGKVDRTALPAPRRPVTPAAAASDHEKLLCALVGEVLQVENVSVGDNFFGLGGDSISSIQLVSRARRAGLALTPREIHRSRTIGQLAELAGAPAPAIHDADTGDVVLTPVMRWLAGQPGPVDGYHQAVLLRVPAALTLDRLRGVVQAVVNHHAMLRSRLVRAETGEMNHLVVSPQGTAEVVEARHGLREEVRRARTRLSPGDGRMLVAVWFPDGARLLLMAHHLVVDGVSWRIVAEDLEQAWENGPAALAPVPTSFRTWARELTSSVARHRDETDRWTSVLTPPAPLLDPTGAAGARTSLSFTVSADSGSLDQKVLLTALALAVRGWRGPGPFTVDLEGHGREGERDLSRTVGWFTSEFPVRLDVGESAAQDALTLVGDQLQALPHKGIGFGLLRFVDEIPALVAAPKPQIGFNHLGRFETKPSDWAVLWDPELLTDEDMPSDHLLEVTSLVVGKDLAVSLSWPRDQLTTASAQRLADHFRAALAELAEPPSHAHMIQLSEDELETLLH